MGIEKIGPRTPPGIPYSGNRPPMDGPVTESTVRVPEDARTGLASGLQSEILPQELPAGFEPLPVGPEAGLQVPGFAGPAGILGAEGTPVGGVRGLRALAEGSSGGTIRGEALARLRVPVTAGDGPRTVSPSEIGLIAISFR